MSRKSIYLATCLILFPLFVYMRARADDRPPLTDVRYVAKAIILEVSREAHRDSRQMSSTGLGDIKESIRKISSASKGKRRKVSPDDKKIVDTFEAAMKHPDVKKAIAKRRDEIASSINRVKTAPLDSFTGADLTKLRKDLAFTTGEQNWPKSLADEVYGKNWGFNVDEVLKDRRRQEKVDSIKLSDE